MQLSQPYLDLGLLWLCESTHEQVSDCFFSGIARVAVDDFPTAWLGLYLDCLLTTSVLVGWQGMKAIPNVMSCLGNIPVPLLPTVQLSFCLLFSSDDI